ncbi:dihydrofolate reductase [Janibacter sp. GS2]|uniref:dihydrofolate reductase n=1 Tax=Janibacter sp. GS2 TaxID=3442646 RepID=UPI003EBA5EE3
MGTPRITLLAAVGPGRVIGDGERMPWHLPEDLKYFKRTTMGHPMVMGRRTFDSMGALPGRRSIVITRQPDWSAEGVVAVGSLEEALAMATDGEGGDEVFVVGGGEIYRLALPVADRLLLTEVHLDPARVAGGVTFPEVADERWTVTWSEDREGFAWTERLKLNPSLDQK